MDRRGWWEKKERGRNETMKGKLEEEEEDEGVGEYGGKGNARNETDGAKWREKKERGRDGPPTLGRRECALLGAFTRAKRDAGEPCVSK